MLLPCIDRASLSKSKARRLRGAAVRKRLWDAVALKRTQSNDLSSVPVSSSLPERALVSCKLPYLEALVQDMHWSKALHVLHDECMLYICVKHY